MTKATEQAQRERDWLQGRYQEACDSREELRGKLRETEAYAEHLETALRDIATTNIAGYCFTGRETNGEMIEAAKGFYREFKRRVEIAQAALAKNPSATTAVTQPGESGRYIPGTSGDSTDGPAKECHAIGTNQPIPFAWYDHFNGHVWKRRGDAKKAAEGGNKVSPLYIGDPADAFPEGGAVEAGARELRLAAERGHSQGTRQGDDPVGRVEGPCDARPYNHFVRLREPRDSEIGAHLFAIHSTGGNHG